ncbi:MAG: pyruvate kinase, partial [Patescibacteria group bacterium]|nr:pyruvate kinase [Patescibacteria group bacterium]
MNSKKRKAKIIATVGPASKDQSIINQLIQVGVDIFRFNL